MDAAFTERDTLVAEVDLALAALRRVLVKAIDRDRRPLAKAVLAPGLKRAPLSSGDQTSTEAAAKQSSASIEVATASHSPVTRNPSADVDAMEQREALPDKDPPLSTVMLKGITIDVARGEIEFNGRTAELSRRQAQLAAVLLKVSPDFIDRAQAMVRAWPDLAASSRATTISLAMYELARRCAVIGIAVSEQRGYGLRLVKAGGGE